MRRMLRDETPSVGRQKWWVEFDAQDRPLTSEIVEWLVDVVTPLATVGVIDAYSDWRHELPTDVEAAQSLHETAKMLVVARRV